MDFTQEEIIQLVGQIVRGQGRSVSEDEAVEVIRWAERCRIEATLLELILRGEVCLKSENGELRFFIDPGVIAEETIKAVESFLREQKT